MVKKIISNLRESRDIVLSAQELVNEQVNTNINSLSGQNKKNKFEKKLKNFIMAIESSTLLTADEKAITQQKPEEIYNRAREITLELIKTEIKNPLAK